MENTKHRRRLIDAPPSFLECGGLEKQKAVATENRRATLRFFGVKVHVFPARVEVRGAVQTRVLELADAGAGSLRPLVLLSVRLPHGKGAGRGYAPL